MKFGKRWRIVPQLWLVFLGLHGLVQAGPFDLPASPATPDEARDIIDRRAARSEQADAEFARQRLECEQRTLISGCLRDVDSAQARYRRDSVVLEKAAKEVLRLDEQQKRDARKVSTPVEASPSGEPVLRADDPDIAPRRAVPAPKAAVPPVEQPSAKPAPKPALSAEEQARNREAYLARKAEAERRQQQNEARLQETREKRAAYQQKLQEKQERDARRRAAAEDAARNRPPTSP